MVASHPNLNIPMYEVKPEVGNRAAKVLHRNLLPCLPVEESDTQNVRTDPMVTSQGMPWQIFLLIIKVMLMSP